jgi:hypothetical protein
VSGVPFCCHKLTTPLALLPAVPQPPAQCPSPRACVCVSSVGRLPAPRSPGPAARVHCHTHTMALPSCLPACSAHRDKSERKRGPDQLLGPGYTPAHWTPDPGARARVVRTRRPPYLRLRLHWARRLPFLLATGRTPHMLALHHAPAGLPVPCLHSQEMRLRRQQAIHATRPVRPAAACTQAPS